MILLILNRRRGFIRAVWLIEALLFFGFLWVAYHVWEWLSCSGVGRVIQVSLVSVIYALWLMVYPGAVFGAISAGFESYKKQNYAGVAIAVVAIPLMSPLGLFALIPWNLFCSWVWLKLGLRLPQTDRLGDVRRYSEYASGRRH